MTLVTDTDLSIEIPDNLNAAYKILVGDELVCILPRTATYSNFRLVHKNLRLKGVSHQDIVTLLNTLELTVNPQGNYRGDLPLH